MKIVKMFSLLSFCVLVAATAVCQERFTSCTAAYLDSKMVVNEYSPSGHCVLSISATGELTVQTMNDTTPTGKIKFKIALRDGNTQTLISYSEKTFVEIPVEKILAKCRPSDSVVLMTTDERYSLPHNEILVK